MILSVKNVHYDKLKSHIPMRSSDRFGQGVGVCEGIAKSVKVLCDALGIWVYDRSVRNNPEKGIKYRHTWNIVKSAGNIII